SKKHIGHGVMVESSKNVKPWREAVVWATRDAMERPDHMPDARLLGPVEIGIVFTVPKPKSAPKTRRTFPDRKPDLDKLCRSTLDAIVTAGVIEDDARVINLSAVKVYPNEGIGALDVPGAVIRITNAS